MTRAFKHWIVILSMVASASLVLVAPVTTRAKNCKEKTTKYIVAIAQSEGRFSDESSSIDFPGEIRSRFSRSLTIPDVAFTKRRCRSGFKSIAATKEDSPGDTDNVMLSGDDTRVDPPPTMFPGRERPCSWDQRDLNPGGEPLKITGNLQSTRKVWNFDLATTAGDPLFASAYGAAVHDAVVAQCPNRALELLSSYSDEAPPNVADGVVIDPWRPDLPGGFSITNAGDERGAPPEWFKSLLKGEAASLTRTWTYANIGFADSGTITVSIQFQPT